MSTVTNYLKLVKYDAGDKITPNGYNENFEKLDNEIHELKKDYVTAYGENTIWYYRKWASGMVELFGWEWIEAAPTAAWNWCYYDPNIKGGAEFPTELGLSNPQGQVTINSDNGGLWLACNKDATNTKAATVWVCSAQTYGTTKARIVYHYWGWVK